MKKILVPIKYLFIVIDKIIINISKIKLLIFWVNIWKNLIFTWRLWDISNIMLVNPNNLKIWNNVFIWKNFYCNAFNKVIIKDNVMISHNVSIISANHKNINWEISYKLYEDSTPIIIWNSTWIWIWVTILPWVKIWNNCILWAMSVITKDVPDKSILVWNPGKIINKNKDENSSNINSKLE